jgi:hypothetical protein
MVNAELIAPAQAEVIDPRPPIVDVTDPKEVAGVWIVQRLYPGSASHIGPEGFHPGALVLWSQARREFFHLQQKEVVVIRPTRRPDHSPSFPAGLFRLSFDRRT